MTRERLPNRRRHDVAEIEHGGFRITFGTGRYDSGRLGELFIDTHKGGSTIDTVLRDCVVLVSFALQAGIDVATIRAAMASSGALAAVLDVVGDQS
jgi:ribonucleoside-diphosphate reductase alpha chain